MKRLLLLSLALLAVSARPGRAQEQVEHSDRADAIFREGVTLYSEGRFADAVPLFERVIRDYPFSQRITAALVMKGKALFRMGENLETAKTMKAFLAQYPSSTYAADADYTLGAVYQRIGRYGEALQSFIAAWRTMPKPAPDRLEQDVLAAIDTTINNHTDDTALRALLTESTRYDERAYLWLKIAEKEVSRDNIPQAAVAIDTIALRYPGNSFWNRMEQLRARISARSIVKLGALIPLMRNAEPSAIKEIGNEVYEGIVLACERYAADPSKRVKVTLETRDTERDPSLAARGARELADDSDVVGVLGPVFSVTATPAAGIASARGMPLITPTANANRLAATGPSIFQGNPDYEMRGRAMARYAVVNRGFTSLAVLAPNDTYARSMAEGFISEAGTLGAKVIATEWYQRGASDLKSQLRSIRRAGMIHAADPLIPFSGKMTRGELMKLADYGIPLKRLDSLMHRGTTVSATQLLGPNARRKTDSLGITVTFDETQIDSLEYAVTGVQGLYVPISTAEEIAVVSSQVVYFHFETQLLGSGEWNNFAELNANRRYCAGVVYESDTFVDSASISYSEFVNAFTARFRKLPGKSTLYGYDAAALVLDLIGNGATTREALTRALAGVRQYQGLHSKIGFSSGRVNSWLQILQYTADDQVRRIDEIHVEESGAGYGERK